MHLSGALYVGRKSKLGKKIDTTTLKPSFEASSHVTVSQQKNASDGSAQPPTSYPSHVAPSYTPHGDGVSPPRRHSSTVQTSEPFVPVSNAALPQPRLYLSRCRGYYIPNNASQQTSLNGILEDENKPSPRREPAPFSKPTNPSSRRNSSPKVTSVVMGRRRSYSVGDLSGEPCDVVRTGSASPRRSSLFSPDPALADDEDGVTGW